MPDDKSISHLVTKSLRLELTEAELKQVNQNLESNKEAAKFAELSKLIQDSINISANPPSEESLSLDAKERFKESVSKAVEEKLSLSQAGLLNNAEESTGNPSRRSQATVLPDDQQRELTSKFKLIRKLGQGGLGNIWLARDQKLNRNVAIKELRPEALESETAWVRFHREAEITGHLEHPNVISLYQYGVDQKSGEPFYAMRFVGKRTLANAIEEHHDKVEAGEVDPLALHRLLSIFLDICQAIAYAHSRGVIHRDLKPENVALDNFGQVIVLDWGLAKVLEDSELATKMEHVKNMTESTLAETMHGDVVGTPLFMSPEQAAGALDQVDERTDIYGLGAILFSILTGDAPHTKSAASGATDVESVLKAISESEPPTASKSTKHWVPSDLERISIKAMARKRHMRFDSVQELANAVESWVAGQSGKQAAYEKLRMEGRELRADLQASVFNLERNVRFSATLPPIKEVMGAESEENISAWRERLSTIFHGLLQANPNYRSITYCATEQEVTHYREIVRVERHSSDASNIRSVPKSRLNAARIPESIAGVVDKKPGEVHTTLICDAICSADNCDETIGLLASVPVYDPKTEEVFGFVVINCDINQMLHQQMARQTDASEIVIACDTFNTMMHKQENQIVLDSMSKKVETVAAHFLPAIETLQTQTDYIDEADADIYGARLWFIPNVHGVMYLLKRKPNA